MFGTVYRILLEKNNGTYKYAAIIASQWINEKGFKEIVQNQIAFKTKDYDSFTKEAFSNNENFVNKIFDELINTINKTLVFHYARLTQCYIDILNVVLREFEMPEVDYALPLSIEYGIYEPTSQIIISKGGSRSLAIRLTRLFKSGTVEFSDWILRRRESILQVLPRTMHEEFLHTSTQ